MSDGKRILLMGCGGIGGVMAANLLERGADLTCVAHNPEIASAVERNGIEVRHEGSPKRVPARAFVDIPAGAGPFDFALLATQPPQVVDAARAALPYLRPEGALVCLQNGLCEERVQAVAGPDRTIGAIVAWGASMLSPGVYERTSEGGFMIGRLDGRGDERFWALREILAPIGETQVTHNLRGARWSKLAINCCISSLGTIGGERLGALVGHRFVRRLGLEIMTEAVAVARVRDVVLEKVSGTIDLDWVALTPADVRNGSPSLMVKHALLLAVGAKFRRLRSSMLAAIERGREPAVDFLNGEVVTRADESGIPVPLNRRVQEVIHAIARRDLRPGLSLLRRLYEETRDAVNTATTAGHRPAAGPQELRAG